MFSLSYLPSAERLTVVVVKARNLRQQEDLKSDVSKFRPLLTSRLCVRGKGTMAQLVKHVNFHQEVLGSILALNVFPTSLVGVSVM